MLSTAVDIGANVGGFCLHAHSKFEKIYAFEPLKQNYHILQQVILQRGLTNVEAYCNAVYSESGKALSLVRPENNISGDVFCSEEGNTLAIEKCETISLSDIIKTLNISKIDYLKMDCEGAEYDIFENFNDFDKIFIIALELHEVGDYPLLKKEALLKKLHEHYVFIRNHKGRVTVEEARTSSEAQDYKDFINESALILFKR
tara:strand:- start:85 stop:690 length:606 start_codon:yes stop_codon:yes gene_type:complete